MKNIGCKVTLVLLFSLMVVTINLMPPMTWPQDEDEDDTVCVGNPNPILTQELLPNFRFGSSTIIKNKKSGEVHYIVECWISCALSDEEWRKLAVSKTGKELLEIERILINITLYSFANQKEAREFAKNIFFATTEKNAKYEGMGFPIRGSYSGQKIGDICWRYYSPEEMKKYTGNPIYVTNPDYDIIFIKNGSLIKLNVAAFAKQIPASFAEDVAKKIVSRIK